MLRLQFAIIAAMIAVIATIVHDHRHNNVNRVVHIDCRQRGQGNVTLAVPPMRRGDPASRPEFEAFVCFTRRTTEVRADNETASS